MGPLGKGPRNDWERESVLPSRLHVVQHESFRCVQRNFRVLEAQHRRKVPWQGVEGDLFLKSAETWWMVAFDGAKILEQRGEDITWLFCSGAPQNILKTTFKSSWSQSAFMLQDPYIQVHVMFAAGLASCCSTGCTTECVASEGTCSSVTRSVGDFSRDVVRGAS